MPELLLGCGSNRVKKLAVDGKREWTDLVTVDFNGDHNPDVIFDLEQIPLPFEDNFADEIHLYDVLEHLGQQGDWRFFFAQMSDFWRILKPNGMLFGISPHWSSQWCWMDPGHKRAIGPEIFTYLIQPEYQKQVGKTSITDYRFVYKADFDLVHSVVTPERQYQYGLRAVKPSRITEV